MSGQPQISIIIPCYNIRQYIGDCLDSIMSQKGDISDGIQVLCIDDGSSDGTSEVLTTYAQKYPEVISVLAQGTHNYGVSSARNFGLNNMTGETLMFVDGDDKIAGTDEITMTDPYFLENFYTTLKSNPGTAMVVGSVGKFSDNKIIRTKHDMVLDQKLIKTSNAEPDFAKSFDILEFRICCWNTLYRSDLINKYTLRFRSDMMYFEDVHFVMQYAFAALKEKYDYILKPTDRDALYLYRSRPDSAITKLSNHSESSMRCKEAVRNCSQYYSYVLCECEKLFGVYSRLYHSFARCWANKSASLLRKMQEDYVFDEPLLRRNTPQGCRDCHYKKKVCAPGCPHLSTLQTLSKHIERTSH